MKKILTNKTLRIIEITKLTSIKELYLVNNFPKINYDNV